MGVLSGQTQGALTYRGPRFRSIGWADPDATTLQFKFIDIYTVILCGQKQSFVLPPVYAVPNAMASLSITGTQDLQQYIQQ